MLEKFPLDQQQDELIFTLMPKAALNQSTIGLDSSINACLMCQSHKKQGKTEQLVHVQGD